MQPDIRLVPVDVVDVHRAAPPPGDELDDDVTVQPPGGGGRRLWLLPLLALPFVARAAWSGGYPTVPLAPLACDAGAPPLNLVLVDDRSSSTYATDPDRRREPELRRVVEWLDDSDCHAGDAVGVAQFDDVLPPVPPVALDRGIDRVLAALPDRAPESSSTLAPPVLRAGEWARAHPRHRNVLVIATDGALADFAEAFDAIGAFPGRVRVLALGPLPSEWALADVDGVRVLTGEVHLGDVARGLSDDLRLEVAGASGRG